ncbi:MAG: hypothetical protein DRI70_09090 [Bacteroidetes bacterium]|nr:MAG: hypothetical protein DRI70_09090 [Bacteroidota bacterium]
MKKLLFSLVLFGTYMSYAQVGIGTTSPTSTSMLEISSTSDGGATYKGFMPPRVPTILNRNAINPTVADEGLVVFVEENECLQIWNGSSWEDIHCLNSISFASVFQNFDLSTSWGYTSDIPFFDNGADGFYGITNSTNGGFSNITTLTNNFLGVLDLDDEGINGTAGFATITFNTINVSAASTGVSLSFDYEFFEFDTGDDAFYTVTIDGIPQTEVQLINGLADLSLNGTISVNAPPGTTTIGLSIRIKQNGAGDYAGFDNFAIVPN